MPSGVIGDPADKRRIERLRQMLCQCRERNTRFQEENERLQAAMPTGDPDHARLVSRIAMLSNLVLELRRELADAKGTFAE
jgi:hypothetical protein